MKSNNLKKYVVLQLIFFAFFFGFISANLFAQKEVWFAKGQKALNNQQFEEAEMAFNKAIELDSNDKEAFYYRGIIYLYTQKADQAIHDFTMAIELDSKYADAYNNRGLTYSFVGELDSAFEDFNKAISIDSKFGQAYLNRGSVYFTKGKLQEALNDYNKAIELDTNIIEVFFQRGIVHHKLNNLKKAIADFTRAIKKGMNNSQVYYNRGNSYYKDKQFKNAIKDYSRVLELDSMDTEALNNRAMAYDKSGNLKKAEEDRKKLKILIESMNPIENLDSIKYKSYSLMNGEIYIDLPEKWFYSSDTIKNHIDLIVSPENLKATGNLYAVGIRFSVDTNMFEAYKVKTPEEILGFWSSSSDLNSKDYYNWRPISEKHFVKLAYKCFLNKVLMQVTEDMHPLMLYELVMAKENVLIFAHFQAPEAQAEYYFQIFEKALETLRVKEIK